MGQRVVDSDAGRESPRLARECARDSWVSGTLGFWFSGCVESAFPDSGRSRFDGANVAKHLIAVISIQSISAI